MGAAFVTGSVILARATDVDRLRWTARLLLVVSMVVMIVGARERAVWLAGLLSYAIANGVLVPSAFGAIATASGPQRSRALGVAAAAQMLLGAIVGALVNLTAGLTPAAFGVSGLAIAIAVLGVSWLERRDHAPIVGD